MSRVVEPPVAATVPVQGTAAKFPVHRIYCIGRNYAEHAAEMGEPGSSPLFFAKPADAVCTAAAVPWPPMTDDLHHEVEHLSLIHISEPTRRRDSSRMPSSA